MTTNYKPSGRRLPIRVLLPALLLYAITWHAKGQCTYGDQTTFGNEEWIGYVYTDFTPGNPPADAFGGTYQGYITQPAIFNQDWGATSISGDYVCGTYADNFAVRFKMQKYLDEGYYNITVAGDDGFRLSCDGGETFDEDYSEYYNHGSIPAGAPHYHPGGTIDFVLEYYEAGGGAQVSFNYTFMDCTSTAPTSISGTTEVPSCNPSTTLTAEGGIHGVGSVYQWGTGNVIGSNIIGGQQAQTLSVSPTSTTTYWVRRQAAYECTGDTDGVFTTVTVVNGAAGDPSQFGDNIWNAYVYNGSNATVNPSSLTYVGYYTEETTGFDSDASWARNSNPTVADSWVGCSLNNDFFTFVYKRKGFPCGDYTLYMSDWDDRVRVYLDGVLLMSYDGWSGGAPESAKNIGVYHLDEDSEIEVRVAEDGGDANAQLNITETNLNVAPTGIAAGIVCKNANVTLTATGGTVNDASEYQWGTGETPGENILEGETGASIATLIEADTYYWVRIYNTECDTYTTAYSQQITVPAAAIWNGSSWSVTPTANTAIEVQGNLTVSSDLEVCSCEVTGTAVMTVTEGTDLTVRGKVTVAPTAEMIFENKASLLQEEDVANEGNISLSRASSKIMRLDYTVWSAPVVGQQLLDFSPNTVTSRFYLLQTSDNLYYPIAPTNNFDVATGYLIRAPNNHPTTPTVYEGTFTGVPNNGTILKPLAYNEGDYSFNAVGNPYPSPLDAIQFINDNSSVIEGTLWLFRKTNNPDETTYCTLTTLGFAANEAAGGTNEYAYDPDGVLNTAQGFFVNALAEGNLTFTNDMRLGNSSNQFFRSANDEVGTSRYWINLTNAAESDYSQMLIGYSPDATNGYDNGIDGRSMADGPLRTYTLAADKTLAIQGRENFEITDTVSVGYYTDTAGTLQFSLDHYDGIFATGQKIYLVDNFLDIVHDITENNYIFVSEEGTYNNRFTIIYTAEALGNDVADVVSKNTMVYREGNIVKARTTGTIDSVAMYDMTGRLLYRTADVNSNEFSSTALYTGKQVIIVKVTLQDKTVISKKIMVD